MAKCFVTVVEGRTMEVEATSLYRAVFAYRAEQICGDASNRSFPAIQFDSVVTVTVEGKPEVHAVVYRRAMDWANRIAEESARRQKAKRGNGH